MDPQISSLWHKAGPLTHETSLPRSQSASGLGPRRHLAKPQIWTPRPGAVDKAGVPRRWRLEHISERHSAFSKPQFSPPHAPSPQQPRTIAPKFLLDSWRGGVGPGLWETQGAPSSQSHTQNQNLLRAGKQHFSKAQDPEKWPAPSLRYKRHNSTALFREGGRGGPRRLNEVLTATWWAAR